MQGNTTSPLSRILVIVPTFNERHNLASLVEEVLSLGPSFAMLVVDDRSPDGTGELADALKHANPGRFDVLHRPAKRGIGRAYIDGFRYALASEADLVVTMDADHSHDPADLPRMVAATGGADLVLASRYLPSGETVGWPIHRRLISRIGGMYARLVLRIPVSDPTGGFKVYRRSALESLDLSAIRSDGYAFQIETTFRTLANGCRIAEIPIRFVDRVAGKSKLSRRIVVEAMIVVWKLRWSSLTRRQR